MDKSTYVNVDFIVKWPKSSLPSKFSKLVRGEFLLDDEGKFFSNADLKDILASWLHDEFNILPLDFNFQIAL